MPLLTSFFCLVIFIPIALGDRPLENYGLLDLGSRVGLQNAYEQWHLFPQDQLTLIGSREAGRMFSSAILPPANASFSIIELDPIYRGPSLPFGGACQLITKYLTRAPQFGQLLRVLNLTGQHVLPQQVSELFSETL